MPFLVSAGSGSLGSNQLEGHEPTPSCPAPPFFSLLLPWYQAMRTVRGSGLSPPARTRLHSCASASEGGQAVRWRWHSASFSVATTSRLSRSRRRSSPCHPPAHPAQEACQHLVTDVASRRQQACMRAGVSWLERALHAGLTAVAGHTVASSAARGCWGAARPQHPLQVACIDHGPPRASQHMQSSRRAAGERVCTVGHARHAHARRTQTLATAREGQRSAPAW